MAEKCTHCEWKFNEGDMVIACPKCGALHHEKCWNTMVMNCSKCGAYTPLGVQFAEKQQREAYDRQYYMDQARQRTEMARQAQERAEQEKHQARLNHLKTLGRDGYYEYKVISIVDKRGAVDIEKLMATLNELGLDGWRLQCAYSNEMGKDSLTIAGFGINSTADQNILIFERFVKFE